MTAITARINSPAHDLAFLRGLLAGVIAALIVGAVIVVAVAFAAPAATPAQAPAINQLAPVQVDANHPLQRPGGVQVY